MRGLRDVLGSGEVHCVSQGIGSHKVGGSEGSSKGWGSHQRREAIKGVSTMSEVLSSTSTKPNQTKAKQRKKGRNEKK